MTMSMDDGTIPFDPNDSAQEAIPEFQEMRFIRTPAHPTKRQEPQPGAMLAVDFDKFWMIVNELSGSGMTNMRRYGEKLQACIVANAPEVLEARLAGRYAEGLADGQAYAREVEEQDPRDITEHPAYKAGYDAAQGGSGVHLQ